MYLEFCYNFRSKVRVGKEEADLVNVCIIGEHCDASYKYCNSASPFFPGSGFSGICMAIKLREAGIDNFRVIEKQPELVGISLSPWKI